MVIVATVQAVEVEVVLVATVQAVEVEVVLVVMVQAVVVVKMIELDFIPKLSESLFYTSKDDKAKSKPTNFD